MIRAHAIVSPDAFPESGAADAPDASDFSTALEARTGTVRAMTDACGRHSHLCFIDKSNPNPNPFNPTTTIPYEIAKAGNIQLAVYNLKGQLIETLVNEYKVPGYYLTTWNGDEFSSGMYFYRLDSGGNTFIGKMLLMK